MPESVTNLVADRDNIQTIKLLRRALIEGKDATGQEVIEFLNKATAIIESLPEYDVIGMETLVARLRAELKSIHNRKDGLDSINKLSAKIQVSRTYLAKFRDGGSVCMNIMNRLAEAFQIRYLIENYEDPKKTLIN